MSKGLRTEQTFTDTADREMIRRKLGQPVRTQVYDPPKPLSQVPEIAVLPPKLQTTNPDVLTTGCDEFEYKGVVYDADAAQAVGMVSATTFFIGEPFAFSRALKHQSKESRKTHFFQVWYRTNSTWVFYTHAEEDRSKPPAKLK